MPSDYWAERQAAAHLLWAVGIVLLYIPSVITRILGAAVLLVLVAPWVASAVETVREWDRASDERRLERRDGDGDGEFRR